MKNRVWYQELCLAVETHSRPDLDDIDCAAILEKLIEMECEIERLKDSVAVGRRLIAENRSNPKQSGVTRDDALRMLREAEAGEPGEPFAAWIERFAALAYAAGQADGRNELALANKCLEAAQKGYLAELAARDLVINQMMDALHLAAETFSEYASIHAAKTPPDETKAAFNAYRCDQVRRALFLRPSVSVSALDSYVAEAVAAERKACAQVCDTHAQMATNEDGTEWSQSCASAIRARGAK